jgi:hypothetical protein
MVRKHAKRPFWSFTHRQEDNIKMNLGETRSEDGD